MTRPARALALLVAPALLAAAPGGDGAAPDRPVAAILVTGEAAGDRFVAAFLSAVLGEALAERGLGHRPPRASAERLLALGGGAGCVADDVCARALARAVGTPLLVFVDVRRAGRRRLAVRATLAVVDEAAVRRLPARLGEGRQDRVAARLAAHLDALDDLPLPCTVEVRGAAAGDAALTLDGAPAPAAPWFPPPGRHRVRAEAPPRPAATTAFTCRGGERLAVEVD